MNFSTILNQMVSRGTRSGYVRQQQLMTLNMAIMFVVHHRIGRLCHDINEIVTRLPTIPTKDQLADRRNHPQNGF